ncbi:MAG: IS110 family transposase [Planctomycetota bacterium]
MNHRTTIIADHHKSVFVCQVLDRETGEATRATLKSRRDELRSFLESLPRPAQVFIEACRSWEWVSDLCEDVGIDFHLVDPKQMPEIARSTKKTDRNDVDAMVKRFLSVGLPKARAASREERDLRALTREQVALRREDRVLVQKIHALIDSQAMPATKKDFAKGEWRDEIRAALSSALRLSLDLLLARWDLVRGQRDRIQEEIGRLSSKLPAVARLQTISGIGPILSATIVAEVPDATVFSSSRQFAAFTGLVPRVRSSAGTAKIGRITKSGPSALRWALTQAIFASQTAKEPTAAYLLYRRKRRRGKPAKVALCAGAHQLARTVWSMLVNETEYRAPKTAH